MKTRTINERFEQQSKKRKNRKRKLKLIIAWIKLILILGIAVTALVFFALSPLFDVKSVEVKGGLHYSNQELKRTAGVIEGLNGFKQIGSSPVDILTFRLGGAEKSLKKSCPYLSEATVRFLIPSSVVISVKERVQYALVAGGGTSLVIDREGYVLETASVDKSYRLPLIKGLKFKTAKIGEKLIMENVGAFSLARNVADIIQETDGKEGTSLYKIVDSIDTGDPQNISISLDKRITVMLGDLEDLNYRISAANTIFNKNIKKDQKGILDFTAEANPVFSPESGE